MDLAVSVSEAAPTRPPLKQSRRLLRPRQRQGREGKAFPGKGVHSLRPLAKGNTGFMTEANLPMGTPQSPLEIRTLM